MSALGERLRAGAPSVATPTPTTVAPTPLGARLRAAPAPTVPPPSAVLVKKFTGGSVSMEWMPPVESSPDLERIVDLPRRTPYSDEHPAVAELAARITAQYRRPNGTQALWPVQAFALEDARTAGGLLAPIQVGGGKTLTAFLLATALGARVSVLMVPPALRAQVRANWRALAKHWRLPNLVGEDLAYPDAPGVMHLVAYSELSSQRGADILDRLHPDLIIGDECHSVARTSSARTKRFLRYFKANPNTKFAGLSGTITNRSIKEFAHLSRLALRDGSPLPHQWPVLEAWSYVLDATETPSEPGELYRLGGINVDRSRSIRDVFRERLVSTPGVVATSANRLGTTLIINSRNVDVPEQVANALGRLRREWVTPGDEPIADALSLAGHARELACGFYYRRIWPRGEPEAIRKEWTEAQKEWFREMREYLSDRAKPGMDSPGLLALAAARGAWASSTWARWAAIKDLAKPDTEAVWIDDFLVEDAVEWGRRQTGIIWYTHDTVGRRIADRGGFELFGGGPAASAGLQRFEGMSKAGRTIVVSANAHFQGKNLQAFQHSLVITPASSGKIWEQLLGRMHRSGQTADEVEYTIYTHVPEQVAALESAYRDAKFIQQTTGGQQRLLYANYTFAPAFKEALTF